MSFRSYSAYGLCIHSEIICPELPLDWTPNQDPDVTIQLLPPIDKVSECFENGYFETRPDLFRMAVVGIGRYAVEEGKRILIEPQAGASEEEVRLFLLGSAFGALLYQRGLFPLHGSAVETSWGAMIFVGEQGVGKSTLAAHFHRKGYRLLSDDVCAIAPTREGMLVLPALAQVRLCNDAYERLGSPKDARFHVDKFAVAIGDGYCSSPVPLKAIHVLSDGENSTPKFELLRGFDRIQKLLENLYRPQYLNGQKTQNELMRLAGTIAQQATMATVTRQRSAESLEGLVHFIESSWAECFELRTSEEKG